MTPQFLRAEAARFREMAEAVTDREASKQRLLKMAIDYEDRAKAAEALQPARPMPEREPETEATTEEPAKPKPGRRIGGTRLSLRRNTE
jgi:hypothetical protein